MDQELKDYPDRRFAEVRQQVGGLRQEVGGLRQEVGRLRQEVGRPGDRAAPRPDL